MDGIAHESPTRSRYVLAWLTAAFLNFIASEILADRLAEMMSPQLSSNSYVFSLLATNLVASILIWVAVYRRYTDLDMTKVGPWLWGMAAVGGVTLAVRVLAGYEDFGRNPDPLLVGFAILSGPLSVRVIIHFTRREIRFVKSNNGTDFEGLNQDLSIAADFFPAINDAFSRLRPYGASLSKRMSDVLLQNKNFADANSLADSFIDEELERRFGADPEVKQFGRELVEARSEWAANELSRLMRVLGTSVPASEAIEKLRGSMREMAAITSQVASLFIVTNDGALPDKDRRDFAALLKDGRAIGRVSNEYGIYLNMERLREAKSDFGMVYVESDAQLDLELFRSQIGLYGLKDIQP